MDTDMIARHLENLDRRLAGVEQILPTLTTKEELRAAIESLATKEELRAAVAPLATKEELRAAVAPLATKEDLNTLATKEDLNTLATREELRELRRHMDVLNESLRGDIHLIAAHVASARPKGNEP
jgi:hypothetical protein